MHLAKTWPGRPDRIRAAGFTQYDPGLLWNNGTRLNAGNRIRHIRSGPIPQCTLAVTKTPPNRTWHVYWEYRMSPSYITCLSFWLDSKHKTCCARHVSSTACRTQDGVHSHSVHFYCSSQRIYITYNVADTSNRAHHSREYTSSPRPLPTVTLCISQAETTPHTVMACIH